MVEKQDTRRGDASGIDGPYRLLDGNESMHERYEVAHAS